MINVLNYEKDLKNKYLTLGYMSYDGYLAHDYDFAFFIMNQVNNKLESFKSDVTLTIDDDFKIIPEKDSYSLEYTLNMYMNPKFAITLSFPGMDKDAFNHIKSLFYSIDQYTDSFSFKFKFKNEDFEFNEDEYMIYVKKKMEEWIHNSGIKNVNTDFCNNFYENYCAYLYEFILSVNNFINFEIANFMNECHKSLKIDYCE